VLVELTRITVELGAEDVVGTAEEEFKDGDMIGIGAEELGAEDVIGTDTEVFESAAGGGGGARAIGTTVAVETGGREAIDGWY